MKSPATKSTNPPQPPVFPEMLHRMRTKPEAQAMSANPTPKTKKRDNTFSKSRDMREDRGERQMKTSKNAQTFSHGH